MKKETTDAERHQKSVEEIAKTHPEIYKEIYLSNQLAKLFARVKHQAKNRKISFNLNPAYFALPEICPVLKIPLQFHTVNADDNSYSVDRIDNTRGYDNDNVCIMSLKANRIKSNATLEELVMVGKWATEELKKIGRPIPE
jgi:hypothetical protein